MGGDAFRDHYPPERRGLLLAYTMDFLRPLLEPSPRKGLSVITFPCGWELKGGRVWPGPTTRYETNNTRKSGQVVIITEHWQGYGVY